MKPTPPIAKRIPVIHRIHGVERIDHYNWLQNRNDPDVMTYLRAENDFSAALMAPLQELQAQIFAELQAQISLEQCTAPYPSGRWMRYARIEPHQDYWVHCRMDEIEEILLDENVRARGHDYYHLEDLKVSPDNRYLAWTEDRDGSERFELWIRELDTGIETAITTENIKWSIAWLDDTHLVYLLGDQADRPYKIQVHRVGTSFSSDVPIWTEDDERFHLSVERARNGRAVICRAESKTTSEIRLLSISGNIEIRTVQHRQPNHKYDVSLGVDEIWIRSNHVHPEYALYQLIDHQLQEVYVPNHNTDSNITIESVDVMSRHLVCWIREMGLQKLVVLNIQGEYVRTLAFPDPCYELYPDVNSQPDTALFRLRYTSLSMPDRVLEYNLDTGEHETIKIFEVHGIRSDQLRCERHWATAHDGTKIPISLVKHVDTPENAPCMLHGYGAYGVSYSPGFHETWMPLLNRGWVMAIAHVRGGGELGRAWYEQGKLTHKSNSFHDFIACAEFLKTNQIARQIVSIGGSAGGLLVSSALNLRPELFAGCVAEVPFVDITNTMLDPTLPLTVIEYEEWGNPNNAREFQVIRANDPYEQYNGQAYPPLLVTAGFWDPRVGYWEPAKWIAKVRHGLQESNHIQLRTDLDSGHAGSSGRQKTLREAATKYAFVLNCL